MLTGLVPTGIKSLSFSECKKQVLANLANFAYDPLNYQWFRRLKIIDIFLSQASEGIQPLQSFAVAGLCNLALG